MEISKIQHNEKISKALSECVTGLGALAVTYGDDASVTATLHVIQERIKTEIKIRPENNNKNNERRN